MKDQELFLAMVKGKTIALDKKLMPAVKSSGGQTRILTYPMCRQALIYYIKNFGPVHFLE